MNLNFFHNLVNLLSLVLGSLIGYDWTQLGITPETAAAIAGVMLAVNGGLKLLLNVLRDGFTGLVKVQPPVK